MKLSKKKILLTGITDSGVLRVRGELVTWLLSEGAEVIVATPKKTAYQQLINMGCKYIEVKIDAHGINPIEDIRLYRRYLMILKEESPDIVLTFTTKPNIYATYACKQLNIKYITNITGRGRALVNPGWKQKLMILMLRNSLSTASCIFFQNDGDRSFFHDHKIGKQNSYHLIPGSGVNLDTFHVIPYPLEDMKEINFLFISRIYKEKGIENYIEAARIIRAEHPECNFHILGESTSEYKNYILQAVEDDVIQWHGRVNNVQEFIANSHCTIHPSYFEGMANVILESAASGRPVITTNIHGCKEGVDNGITGYIYEVKSTEQLVNSIKTFLSLSYDEKVAMGLAGRRKIEVEFDRRIVLQAYMQQITTLI